MSEREPDSFTRPSAYDTTLVHDGHSFHVRYRADVGENPEVVALITRMIEFDHAPTIDRAEYRRLGVRLVALLVEACEVLDGGRPLPITEEAVASRVAPGLLDTILRGAMGYLPLTSEGPPLRWAALKGA